MKEKDLPVFNDFDNTGWDVHYKKNKYILIKKGDVEVKIKKDGTIVINNWPDNKNGSSFSTRELKDLDRLVNIFRELIKNDFNEIENPKIREVKNPKGPFATPENPMEYNQPKGPDASRKEIIEKEFNIPPSEYNIKIHQHGSNGAYVNMPKGPKYDIPELEEVKDPGELVDTMSELPEDEMGPEIPIECPNRRKFEFDDEDENNGPEMDM